MSFARLHKWVTYGIAGLGLLAISIGPELELTSELVIFAAFAGSFFVDGPIIRDPRWVRGWTIGLLVFFALQIGRGVLGEPLLPLVLELTAALQVSRLFNRRGAREHQQIGALALLQLIAATVISTEISYAFAFLGFVVVAPWMLSLGHLRAEIEAQQVGREGEAREQAVARILESRRLVTPTFLAGVAALALPLFAMTGVLFLAFPRVGLGFLSFGRDFGQHVSGFGANVELGDFGLIRTDPTVVLRVTPPDLGERPPPFASIRMRGTSFDQYDGRRWTRSRETASEGVPRSDAFYPVPIRFPTPGEDRPWAIVLDPLDEPVLFLPPETVGIEVPPRLSGGVDIGREIVSAPGVDIRYADADGLGLRYTAWTAEYEQRPVEPLSDDERARHLQIPEGHERVAALAREWASGAETDPAKIAALMARLRDSGDYVYSLEMPEVGDRQPLDVFLFEARRGHCEYYSTAMAVMLRSLGIPTRNVTGFLGGRYNPYGEYYAISQGDAHSWLEAWLPERGWVTVDPTPPGRDSIVPDPGWLGALREVMDAIRTRWSEDVVGYDLRSQVELFRSIRSWLSQDQRGPAEAGAPEPEPSRASTPEVPAAAWVGLALGALALFFLVRFLRRRARGRAADEGSAVRLYRALDAALAALGHPRPPERTPSEHLAALAETGFGELDLARRVTRRYLDARFGGIPLPAEEADRLLEEVKSLRGRRDLFRAAP